MDDNVKPSVPSRESAVASTLIIAMMNELKVDQFETRINLKGNGEELFREGGTIRFSVALEGEEAVIRVERKIKESRVS